MQLIDIEPWVSNKSVPWSWDLDVFHAAIAVSVLAVVASGLTLWFATGRDEGSKLRFRLLSGFLALCGLGGVLGGSVALTGAQEAIQAENARFAVWATPYGLDYSREELQMVREGTLEIGDDVEIYLDHSDGFLYKAVPTEYYTGYSRFGEKFVFPSEYQRTRLPLQ